MTTESSSLTVRVPGKLHRAAAEAAERSRCSLNTLVRRSLEAYLQREEDERLGDSFSRLAEAIEECDVEFAWDAQREALEHAP